MNDWKTKDIVSCILEKMGYKLLSKSSLIEENLDILIRFIKYKKEKFGFEVRDMINYFL